MSTLSPQEYAESESSANRRSQIVAFAFVVLAALYLWWAGWLSDPNSDANSVTTQELVGKPASVETPESALPASENGRLTAQLLSVTTQLPQSATNSIRQSVELARTSLVEIGDAEFGNPEYERLFQAEFLNLAKQIESLKDDSEHATKVGVGLEASLTATIAQIDASRAQQITDAVELAKEQVRSRYAPEIREAQLNERDLRDKIENLKGSLAKAEQSNKEQQQKLARAAVLQRDMAQVRQYLSPFISPGHIQPNSRTNAAIVISTVEAKPVSLARLEQLGALEPTIEGLHQLHRFGTSTANDLHNDRPRGAFPSYGWAGDIKKTAIRYEVQKAQNLLRLHSKALVEARLLSP
tara:strand:- start:4566 stop:5627 length:1062 start_codon:yes stop_codon:yes gene_type:complete